LAPGSYNIIFDIYDRVGQSSYQDVQSLTYRKQKYSPFIYTDKGMYKPGDTVKFSIFCIDSETKPYNPTSGSVSIYDSSDVKIKTFANISFVKGKYKGSLDLSDLAAEKVWKVKFDAETTVIHT
jgi:uncharacterized protein YfaS (alpha-2-macroglobulin family)